MPPSDEAEPQPVAEGERRHVLIIGAGLVGLASAFWLQKHGHHATLIDRDPPLPGASWREACSYGNACTMAPHGGVPVAAPRLAWRVPGMLANPAGPLAIVWRYLPALAPWFIAFLRSSSAAEVERIAGVLASLLSRSDGAWQPLIEESRSSELVRRNGCLHLSKTEADFQAAEADNHLRERHGVALDRLDASAVRALEPRLAPLYRRGVLFRDAYTIDNPKALAGALAQAIVARGGSLVHGEAHGLKAREIGIAIWAGGGEHGADHLFIAAGAWSRALAKQAGDHVLLDTERGYHVMFPRALGLLSRPAGRCSGALRAMA
jgi:D-amino-acid dehydrogenase